MFTILNLVNLIIAFIIYGGQIFLSAVTFITSSLIFGLIYINNHIHVLLFDSSIIILSILVLLKFIHTLFLEMWYLASKVEKEN